MTADADGWTREDLIETLKVSWFAVEASGVPDHVQKLAFKEAVRSLLGTAPQIAGRGDHRISPSLRAGIGEVSEPAAKQGVSITESEVLRSVSEETGVPAEKLERVVHVDDGAVKLIGQHTKYGSRTSEQARTIAQIVTIVRNTGMEVSDTSFEVIRAACESKHCYDPKNFASDHMPKIDGFVIKGEGRGRRLEPRGPGIAAFPGLIDKVLGEV